MLKATAQTEMNDEAKHDDVGSDQRRPYVSPRLTHLGSVAELTLGAGGSRGDGPLGRTRTQ